MRESAYPRGKGKSRHVLVMAKAPGGDVRGAIARLAGHMADRQWSADWRIYKVSGVHLGESGKLGAYAPRVEHHLAIEVWAKDHRTLVRQTLPAIHRALGGPHPSGHVLFTAMEADH